MIDCLLDGDEDDNSARKCLLQIGQRAADGISKPGRGPGEGQAVHVSDDYDRGITSIAVTQLRLDGVLPQVNIVNVDQELEQPLASNVAAGVGLREGRRHVGDRRRHLKVTHGGQFGATGSRRAAQLPCEPLATDLVRTGQQAVRAPNLVPFRHTTYRT